MFIVQNNALHDIVEDEIKLHGVLTVGQLRSLNQLSRKLISECLIGSFKGKITCRADLRIYLEETVLSKENKKYVAAFFKVHSPYGQSPIARTMMTDLLKFLNNKASQLLIIKPVAFFKNFKDSLTYDDNNMRGLSILECNQIFSSDPRSVVIREYRLKQKKEKAQAIKDSSTMVEPAVLIQGPVCQASNLTSSLTEPFVNNLNVQSASQEGQRDLSSTFKSTLYATQLAIQSLLSSGPLDEQKQQTLTTLSNAAVSLMGSLGFAENSSGQGQAMEVEPPIEAFAMEEVGSGAVNEFDDVEFFVQTSDETLVTMKDFEKQNEGIKKQKSPVKVISDFAIYDYGEYVEMKGKQQVNKPEVFQDGSVYNHGASTSTDQRFFKPSIKIDASVPSNASKQAQLSNVEADDWPDLGAVSNTNADDFVPVPDLSFVDSIDEQLVDLHRGSEDEMHGGSDGEKE